LVRASTAGRCDHLINRGNSRAEVFHKPEDFDAFLRIMAEAGIRRTMRIIADCPVLRPRADADLGSRGGHSGSPASDGERG
jgi:putative transposase